MRRSLDVFFGDPSARAGALDAAQVDALFERIGQAFGRLDLLFNNAGTGAPPAPIDQLSPAQWDRVVAVNAPAGVVGTQ